MSQVEGGIGSKLRCLWRGRHNPVRHPLGGFRCTDCHRVGVDLVQMGFHDLGTVPSVRRTFAREHGELTRTSRWEPGPTGW